MGGDVNIGNSLAEVDMKNGCVTDTWKRDPGTVFQNVLIKNTIIRERENE